MTFDYETLRVIWWALLGVLLIAFAVTDGFDLGIAILLYRVAKTDTERRVTLNTVGPVWEGNQVWLILGAGAIFAAWPMIYAVSFSGFYFAMLIILAALILRPIGFKYRSKVNNPTWRAIWDFALFLSGVVPALLFGVAVGNVILGVPFYFDKMLRVFYLGSLSGLLNPFALLCGVLSVAMCMMHGANYLAAKTTGIIQQRAAYYAKWAALLVITLFAMGGYNIMHGMMGYALITPIAHDGYSNPLYKQVLHVSGAWMDNYHEYHWAWVAPYFGFIGALTAFIAVFFRYFKFALVMSALSMAGIIATVGVTMFPFLLPSSIVPSMSLLVWDSSSSRLTLLIMLVAAVIFVPIILLYTTWVYRVLSGKVTESYIEENRKNVY